MKISKFKIKHFISSFLNIMESGKTISLSLSMCCLSILIGFCENLSYYFKLRYFVIYDRKMVFFKNLIFYLNFSNLLYLLESTIVSTIVFYLVQSIVYFFILYLFMITFLRKFHFSNILKSKTIEYFNYLFQYFVSLYYWLLFVPILEVFSNIVDCDWYSYLRDDCSSHFSLSILSIIAMIITIIIGFFILWLYRTYMFLDKGLLKKKFTMILAVIYITKVILVVLFPLVKEDFPIIIFILLHIIGIYSLFDYIKNFPISNRALSQFYISVLTCYETLCIIFTIFEYTNMIEEQSLFYILAFSLILSIKLGLKIHENIYHNLLKFNFENQQFLGYCLEELYRLYHGRNSRNRDAFFFGGILKLHISKCKHNKCVLKEEILNEFEFINLEERDKIINNFIAQNFILNIKKIRDKSSANARNFELIILKFSSFMQKNNSSPLKAFYDMQKIFSLYKQKSFFFQSISASLLGQVRSIINLYESKWFQSSSIDESKEIDIKNFSEMYSEKLYLRKIFIALLEKKFIFWDKFKDGFHTYEEIIESLNFFLDEAVLVRKIIDNNLLKNKNSQKKIFDLKFKTIFECIIFNNVNMAVKNEEELDKTKKKELTLEKNILNCDSFFIGNYATIQASFLNSSGKILEVSKKERLAKFFGYNMEEIKSISEIQTFMPKFISKNHKQFVTWYLKKDRSLNLKEKKFIPTYGIDKKGFIFPIKLYVGFNFDYRYDIVFHSALLDLNKRDENVALFDKDGKFLGITKEFCKLFKTDHKNLDVKIFRLFNIFNFSPNLKGFLSKNRLFEDDSNLYLGNQVTQIYFPHNFDEIIKLFTFKLKEDKETKSIEKSLSKSYISIRSQKTVKSMQTSKSKKTLDSNKSKTSNFINKFLQNCSWTVDEKHNFEQKLQDRNLNNFDLMEVLIDKNKCRKHKINFNLKVIRYFYSPTDSLSFCQMSINKTSKDLREFPIHTNKFNTFYDPKSANMKNKSEVSSQDLEAMTIPKEDEVVSNFVVMPMDNKPAFRNQNLEFEENNNRLMTTENDVLPFEEEKNVVFKADLQSSNIESNDKNQINSINFAENLTEKKNEDKRTKALKTPPPESSINTSNNSYILREKNMLGMNNTSNQKVIDFLEHSSQKSSITNVKKTFTIFAIINLIQKNAPSCIINFIFSQIFGLMIILGYCIAVYVMSVQYIDNYFNPINEGVLNFAKMYNTYSCTNLVTVEYEYAIYNFTDYQNGFTFNHIYKKIITESYDTLKEMTKVERSKPSVFAYQDFFKSVFIEASDLIKPIMSKHIFVDFLDSIKKQLYELKSTNFEDMNLEKLEYLSINYVNFLNIYYKITEKIDQSFYETNMNIEDVLKVIMILFVLIIFVLKGFEYCQLAIFYRKMIKILNIFLRVNQKEAFNELFLTKDIQEVIFDPLDAYLNFNFIDKVLTKKDLKFLNFENEEKNGSTTSKSKTREKKKIARKKLSFQDLKPYSRLPLLLFIGFFGFIILIYIGMNYYYYEIINSEIKNLINITIFFEKIYTLPTTVLMINRIILRERVIINKLYNQPDLSQRRKDLNQLLQIYFDELEQNTVLITKYSLGAVGKITDPHYNYLLYGDACEALRLKNLITDSEKISCQDCLNQAFQKGILNIITEILRGVKNEEELRMIYSDQTLTSDQLNMIFERLKKNVGTDRVNADFFLNKLLVVFYQDLENFYKEQMLMQVENLKKVVLITTIFLLLILILEIYMSHQYYKKFFRNISLCLNLIPYDKLLNDEQTLFLIKKYWRE